MGLTPHVTVCMCVWVGVIEGVSVRVCVCVRFVSVCIEVCERMCQFVSLCVRECQFCQSVSVYVCQYVNVYQFVCIRLLYSLCVCVWACKTASQ